MAITGNAAAYRLTPRALVSASRANQLPVRIARRNVAGECPNIGNIGDLIRIAVDNRARLVAGDRDHLRYKTHRQLRRTIARFGTDQFGLVDRHKSRFGLLLVLLAVPDRALETLIDF